ncbi:MAG TPA: PaaI family thioesterase [Thermoanaerobaculia bacterium]|nr:PaaI family thioesterase [Thermoanaerobaculia bacterium]
MNREDFEPVAPEVVEGIREGMQRGPYLGFLGIEIEEVRMGWAQMRLPYRRELDQPGGVVHGGAIASLLDTVVVPAILTTFQFPRRMLTLDLNVHYLTAAVAEDLIAVGWMRKSGRSIAFLAAEARKASGEVVAHAEMTYKVTAREEPREVPREEA